MAYDRGTPTLQERFWSRVEKTPDCWLWVGATNAEGYGQLRDGGKLHFTHRLSFTWAKGAIPEGVEVCHDCDTPGCVRPDHLFLGTHRVNMLDAAKKGRMKGNGNLRGETIGGSKLTEARVREIRASTEADDVLATRFGVSRTAIGKVRRGETWRHV